MDPRTYHDGLDARTALLVQRLRTLLIALRDSGFELQEVVTTIETTAAEHRRALCGAPISSASASSTAYTSPSAGNPS